MNKILKKYKIGQYFKFKNINKLNINQYSFMDNKSIYKITNIKLVNNSIVEFHYSNFEGIITPSLFMSEEDLTSMWN